MGRRGGDTSFQKNVIRRCVSCGTIAKFDGDAVSDTCVILGCNSKLEEVIYGN